MRLVSASGIIFVRLRRGGLTQSISLFEGCGAPWWVLSELVNVREVVVNACLSCGGVRSRCALWSERCSALVLGSKGPLGKSKWKH
jgi:hypothetical protein